MNIGKRLLVAGLVATALIAVAASAASAAVWKDKGTNVSSPITIGLSGGEVFEIGSSGMSCELAVTLATSGGSTGTITKYETKKCEKGFGELAACTVTSSEPKNLPWTVDVNATDLTITNWKLKRSFNAGCKFGTSFEKTVGSVTLTLDKAAEISSMEFLGQITGFKTFGSFTVDAPNAGTYGIG